MKHLLIVITGVLISAFGIYNNSNKQVVNVYLFWGDGCPHCEEAKEFFDSIEDEYGKYYNLIEYEVWRNKDNKLLMNDTASYLNFSLRGVPYIVIGDKSFNGYNNSIGSKIKDEIKNQYNNKNYIDVVESLK